MGKINNELGKMWKFAVVYGPYWDFPEGLGDCVKTCQAHRLQIRPILPDVSGKGSKMIQIGQLYITVLIPSQIQMTGNLMLRHI